MEQGGEDAPGRVLLPIVPSSQILKDDPFWIRTDQVVKKGTPLLSAAIAAFHSCPEANTARQHGTPPSYHIVFHITDEDICT